jgi:DNA invertase Pin-like site-specific DNA recombinase
MSRTNSTPVANGKLLTVAYRRRSSPKQADSIERQQGLIREYANRQGLTIDRELTDTRPGDEIERREGLQELLRLVSARQVGILILDEWERLGRGDPDEVQAEILYPLKKGKVELHTVKDGPRDLHGLAGRVLNTISASQANEEVIKLSRRVASGQPLRARRGERLGGKDNYGYIVRRETVNVPGRGPRLVPVGMDPDPDRAHWVRYIFRRYIETLISLEALARELEGLGAPAPRGGHWSESGLRYILRNPVYLGTLVRGRRTVAKYYIMGSGDDNTPTVRDPDEKGKERSRPEKDWTIVLDHHEPIIDRPTWDRAQARLRTNRNVGKVSELGCSLFSGLVHCKACGRLMHAASVRGERLYRCRPKDRTTGCVVCSWRAVRETELLASFCTALSDLATNEELLDAAVAHLRDRLSETQAPIAARQRQTRRDELQQRIERAKDNLTVLPKDRVADHLKRLDALEQELAHLDAEEDEAPAPQATPKDWPARVRALLQSADRFAAWLRTQPLDRQRDIVQEAVTHCEVEFERQGRHLVPVGGTFLLDPSCLGLDAEALCPALQGVSWRG